MNDKSSSQIALSITDVSYSYKDHEAIKNISFDVLAGKTFGLVGLNGAGKTTLMKSILGLLQDYSGEIKIFDVDASDKQARKKLTFLPEKFEPSWFLTGKEFISFACSFYEKKIDEDTLKQAAESLQLEYKFLNKKVNSYSKGMRQKLGLISAFLSGCPLIMLDEPMSGLDPRARIFVKNEMSKARDEGRTIFFSSHILADVEELCDEISIIHAKELCFLGAPATLKDEMKESNLEKAFLKLVQTREDEKKLAA
jgi:ABC-2 type transport system ATP-binding protein